jgi:hypothetical protein
MASAMLVGGAYRYRNVFPIDKVINFAGTDVLISPTFIVRGSGIPLLGLRIFLCMGNFC